MNSRREDRVRRVRFKPQRTGHKPPSLRVHCPFIRSLGFASDGIGSDLGVVTHRKITLSRHSDCTSIPQPAPPDDKYDKLNPGTQAVS